MKIEQLSTHDVERLKTIRLRSLKDAPDAFGSTFEETISRPFESWHQQLQDLPTFVAVIEESDVGMVRIAPDQANRDGIVWLISMWVAPESRGQGVGEALIEAIVTQARAQGHSRILLDVGDHNAPAIGLYARMGFVPTGEVSAMPPPREHISEHQRELKP